MNVPPYIMLLLLAGCAVSKRLTSAPAPQVFQASPAVQMFTHTPPTISCEAYLAEELRVSPDLNPRHAVIQSRKSSSEPAAVIAPNEITIPVPPMPGVGNALLQSAPDPRGPWVDRTADIIVLGDGSWRIAGTTGVAQEFYKIVPCEMDN